jgi:beta-phosphoglucomutase
MNATRTEAVIFDLDGVLVETDRLHYQSWVETAAELKIPFSRETFDRHMRGRTRADALAEMLDASDWSCSAEERARIAQGKNEHFLRLLAETKLTPVPGAVELIEDLRRRGIKLAVGSSSRNARLVLQSAGLEGYFDVVVDSTDLPGKPAPEIFLRAAELLKVSPACCVVIEDALDGIASARRAGMCVIAVGPHARFGDTSNRVASLSGVTIERDGLLSQTPALD